MDEQHAVEYHQTRLRRAQLWLQRAQEEERRGAEKLMFFWVAFEAMFARHKRYTGDSDKKSHRAMNNFIEAAVQSGGAHIGVKEVIKNNKGEIKRIINLRYTAPDFWTRHDASKKTPEEWEAQHQREKEGLKKGLELRNLHDCVRVMKGLFGRLYSVRNQIFHGGHSLGGQSQGREQVKWALHLLEQFIPVFLDALQKHPHIAKGEPPFPRVAKPNEKRPPFWMD